jgi:hypothetical protein
MRLKMLLVFLLAYAGIAFGQSTTVTGTLVDSTGTPWLNAQVTATFYPTPGKQGPFIWSGGALVTNPAPVVASNSGAFSISLPSNTSISPANSQWSISVCPAASMQCVVLLTPVTGNTQDISALFTQGTIPPGNVAPLQVPRAYNTNEAFPVTPAPGAMLWDVTTLNFQYWNGTAWSTLGSGGSGTPAGPGFCVQYANTGATSFACDPTTVTGGQSVFSYNPTTHNLTTRELNGLAFASSYQTGAGGNGQANFFAANGANQVIVADVADGTETDIAALAATPDNSAIIDIRPSNGNRVNLGDEFKNCAANRSFWGSAFSDEPYCATYTGYFSNSNNGNNILGSAPLLIGSYRDGPGYSLGFGTSGSAWTVTPSFEVNVADYSAGIANGIVVNFSKNGDGDINIIEAGGVTSGGQGTAASDQGLTAYGLNFQDADVRIYQQVASTTGTGDEKPVPTPFFAGTQAYARWDAGLTDWALNSSALISGSTGGVVGAYIDLNNQGSGMTDGNYTVSCIGGGGSGASIAFTVIAGKTNPVSAITSITPGAGYTHGPVCNTFSPAPGGVTPTFIPMMGVAGTMTTTVPVPGSSYLQMITVAGATLAPSTGDVVTSSTAPMATLVGTYQNDTMTAVVNNNHPVVPGFAWSADTSFPETIQISNVSGGTTTGSTQTFTISHLYPKQSGMNIYQGGSNGCFLQRAMYLITADMMCDFAFGAYDSTHMIVGKLSHGGLNVNVLPNGYFSTTPPYNGFQIIAGTPIVAIQETISGVSTSVGGQPTLEHNVIPWVVNDWMLGPKPTGFDVTGMYSGSVSSNSPSDNGDVGIFLSIDGPHFDSNTVIGRFDNDTTSTFYKQNGGNLTEPNGFEFNGVWNTGFFMSSPPASFLIGVNDGGEKMVFFSGSLGITEDVPNNRWDVGNAGFRSQGNVFGGSFTYAQSPGINIGDQELQSLTDGAGNYYSAIGNNTSGDVSGVLGLEAVDAGVIRAGTLIPNFVLANNPATPGSTTYSWVATSQTPTGGETLPSGAITSTIGPATLSPTNFFRFTGQTQPGAQYINIYRTAGASVGLICHLNAVQAFGAGCIDQGQAAGVAVPTVDTSGKFFIGGTGTDIQTSNGTPSGSCSPGSIDVSLTGSTTNNLWVCTGGSAWQLIH